MQRRWRNWRPTPRPLKEALAGDPGRAPREAQHGRPRLALAQPPSEGKLLLKPEECGATAAAQEEAVGDYSGRPARPRRTLLPNVNSASRAGSGAAQGPRQAQLGGDSLAALGARMAKPSPPPPDCLGTGDRGMPKDRGKNLPPNSPRRQGFGCLLC